MEVDKLEEDVYQMSKNLNLLNYQVNIIALAKKQNSIVFLPTGSGKTVIAIHVLCSKTSEIMGDFPEKAKRAFFLAPTKVLVYQLHKQISILTKFKVAFYVGDMLVNFWDKEMWQQQFKEYEVLVMTGEILRQILELKFIAPNQISLIVFDECHHAVLEHPYNMILQQIVNEPISTAPLLLGLSAVLLNANPNKNDVRVTIKNLKNSFRGTILTTSESSDVRRLAPRPQEKILTYTSQVLDQDLLHLYDEVINILNDIKWTSQTESLIPKGSTPFSKTNIIRTLKHWFVNAKEVLEECGIFCGASAVLYYIILVEKRRLRATEPEEIQILVYCRTALLKIRHVLITIMGDETKESIFQNSSNKIQVLLYNLLNMRQAAEKDSLPTLIFVRKRVTAITIATLLKRLKKNHSGFSFLKPEFIIGTQINDSDTLMHELNNQEIIKQFASQNINLLVATNLLEEGIDITICSLVISFDFPVSYASYFQSKGRTRDRNGVYFVLIQEEELGKKSKLLNKYRQIEEELYDIILSEENHAYEREVLSFHAEDMNLLSIKAVYRYCNKLPQDRYSCLYPTAWYTNIMGQKKAFLQFPINCPIQGTIEGEIMPNSKLAKRSVFSKALKELREAGEIDENFNPVLVNEKAKCYDYLFPHFKNEKIDNSLPLPGSKKRKQIYEAKFAESLSECLPQPGHKAYLHVIDFNIKFEEVEREDKITVQEVLRSPVTFGMLSSKKLCKICQFPMFLDMGQIDCDLLINHDEIVLSQLELEDIKLCHFAVFQKLLRIIKNSQIFDNRNKGHSFYVVPVKKIESGRFVLDWEVIRCDFCKDNKSAVVKYNPFQSREKKRKIPMPRSWETLEHSNAMVPVIDGGHVRNSDAFERDQEPKFVMSEAEYMYFVISPNYRNVHPPQTYIVSKFCFDLSPLSPFPRSTYEDYFTYYQDKYMIEITNVTQPLMKVAHVFTCSNFNKPKYYENQERGKGMFKSNDELLVPELCDILPFDRRYWLKALLLPTALNRITHLYYVEEFRRKIISDTGLGQVDFPIGTEWRPLEIDIWRSKNESNENASKLQMTLPLSQLKDKAKFEVNCIDAKRDIFEIGVCDLEYFVTLLGDIESENEMIESMLQLPKVDSSLIQLENEVSVPFLSTLKGKSGKLGPDLAQLVQTFTSSAANDILNYERLEILGDAFLKYAVSCFLFINLNENEGTLTFLKGKLLGNRNLLYCGLTKGFQHVLNVSDFSPLSDWNPPLVCLPEKLVDAIMSNNADPAVIYRWDIPSDEQLSGKLSDDTLSKNEEITRNYDKAYDMSTNSLLPYKSIADKTISDSVEAVIGVYLWEFGLPGGLEILTWLDILPKPSGSYSRLIEKPYNAPELGGTNVKPVVMNILREVPYSNLEKTLGYEFKSKALLLEAITHPSYVDNRITNCYQRLEFLGDAILDFLLTSYLYEYCGHLSPGEVTDVRSALVNNITLASLSVRYDFHKYLLKLNSGLNSAIEKFVVHQASKNHVVNDNVLILLEEKDCLLAEAIQVPKPLGDIFESLAGAIYLDSGNSLETVWAVYYPLMKNEIHTFKESPPKNSVRLLHEICEEKPIFETELKNDLVQATCTAWYGNTQIKVYALGTNGNEAKQSAAKFAVKKIYELKK